MLIEASRGVTRLIATTTVEILTPEAGTGMQLIRELETTRGETLRYFSLDRRDLMRTYTPGKWPSDLSSTTPPIARRFSSIASAVCAEAEQSQQ